VAVLIFFYISLCYFVKQKERSYPTAMLWNFCDYGAGYKTADLLTYLLTYLLKVIGAGFRQITWSEASVER